ncbi:threonine--tRNA ligase [Staphylococcus saprophyticus]
MDNILVTFPDGKSKYFKKNTTLKQVAKNISSSFAKNVALARVNNQIFSLDYEIKENVKVEFLDFNSNEALTSIRYTISIILAKILSETNNNLMIAEFGTLEHGFYADFKSDETLKSKDLNNISKKLKHIINSNPTVQTHLVSREEALYLFDENRYFHEKLIQSSTQEVNIVEIDNYKAPIEMPVIQNLSKLKSFELQNISGTNWNGDVSNEKLQRISGLSFTSEEKLNEYKEFLSKYEEINHRKLGQQLDLFSFSEYAPGMPFYSHNGQTIRLGLQDLLRTLQFQEDYQEVYTPFIMDETLWKDSGHWDHYKDNMYFSQVDDREYAIKPMNCPGHMLIYKNTFHSYRDLPIRMAEFGQVHRHELSGSLNGLFRVRTFNQDDAHIYVRQNQIESEIKNVLKLVDTVYSLFDFSYEIELSTRPDDYMGSIDLWDFAEKSLENVLESSNLNYKINEKDGAFYGPKIDIHINDALNRSHQCGTVQLDFQMPEKFDLSYINENNQKETPVVIHRAIYGSIDRFIGILLEHYGGALPTWLSPNQVNIIPVNIDFHLDKANEIKKLLKSNNIRTSIDSTNEKMGYKIRTSQMKKIPYTIVIGDNEIKFNTLSVRKYGESEEVSKSVQEFTNDLIKEINPFSLDS